MDALAGQQSLNNIASPHSPYIPILFHVEYI